MLKLNLPLVLLPVLGEGAKLAHYERMLESKPDYIALSFDNKQSEAQIEGFIAYIYKNFPYLYEKKVHTLGIYRKKVFEKFPIYSCDTSTSIVAPFKYNVRNTLLGKVNGILEIEKYFRQYAKTEKYLTALWASRGYIDDNFPIK